MFHGIQFTSIPDGSFQSFVGAVIFAITGIGLGWVNAAADYSRYLPRTVSSKSVVGWTVLGASIVPIILVIYGAALSGSSKALSDAISMDPIGALTTLLPTWFLIPICPGCNPWPSRRCNLESLLFRLALVSMGVPIKRYQAAIIDAIIMFGGAIYIVWVADNFFYPFQGFLITLGVPVAVWSSIFVADVLIRKKAYSERDLLMLRECTDR
jgi:nucleobase:cation symporter-1, NCS1 family